MQKTIENKAQSFVKEYMERYKKPVSDAFIAGANFVKDNVIIIVACEYCQGIENISQVRITLEEENIKTLKEEILKEYKDFFTKNGIDLSGFLLKDKGNKLIFWDDTTGDYSLTVKVFKNNQIF